MKKFLTAVAVLLAGISVASAQNATTPTKKVPPPSSINAGGTITGNSGSESNRAAHGSMAPKKMQKTAYVVHGKSRFCTKAKTGKELNCKYATMAACKKIAVPGTKLCMQNPKMATTGAGASTKMR